MIDRLLRKLPSFMGKRRLARLLLSSEALGTNELTVDGKFGCTYTLPNVQETIGFEILINGIYEAETIQFISKRIKASGKFLDIGANIGAISIPLGKLRTDIQICSLEAAPWIFKYLKQNVLANQLTDITLINKAISSEGGKLVDFFSPKDKFGKGSLAPIFTNTAERVETITIDELVYEKNNTVDFIKVDVEGFEALAFRGGQEFLRGKVAPDILFEFVDWAEELAGEKPGCAQAILMDYGYKLYTFDRGVLGDQLSIPITKGGQLIFATKQK